MGEGKFRITEVRHSIRGNTKMAAMLQVDSKKASMEALSDEEIQDGACPWSRESTDVITVHQANCSCGNWQHHKYPCRHAKAFI